MRSDFSEHPTQTGGKMSKRLGGIIGFKDKISSWHLNGFPNGTVLINSNIVLVSLHGD